MSVWVTATNEINMYAMAMGSKTRVKIEMNVHCALMANT